MKNIISFLLCIISYTTSAQNINNYKYIVIPETYEITGKFDQYRLNSLTKFLFEKEGFNTLMSKEKKPADLKANPCLALYPDLENNSGIFTTKLFLKLEDCDGNTVFKSEEGSSKEKDYKTAYHEALRKAFESVKELNYLYEASASDQLSTKKEDTSWKKVEEISKVEEKEIEGEAKNELEHKELVEDLPEQTTVTAIPSAGNYIYNGSEFRLVPNERGFKLYQGKGTEPIALLVAAGQAGTYIYQSLSNQGIAYFKNDRLIIEYYDTVQGKKVQIEYTRKN